MSLSDDLIERINKIFFIYFKDDPEFQYDENDFDEKDIITEIDRDASTKFENEIHLHFNSKKINIIKNLNITKNLIVYPYFSDFLPPSNIINSEIKYFVNKIEVSRDNLKLMLFEKEAVNDGRNINFIFPKTCLQNIGNKLYINEFGREIVQLTINYINNKLINYLLLKNLSYEKRLSIIENKLNIPENNINLDILNEDYTKLYLKDYIKIKDKSQLDDDKKIMIIKETNINKTIKKERKKREKK